jgi:hypothetical protein
VSVHCSVPGSQKAPSFIKHKVVSSSTFFCLMNPALYCTLYRIGLQKLFMFQELLVLSLAVSSAAALNNGLARYSPWKAYKKECLKGQCHEIFYPRFFRQSITPRPLINTLKYFRFCFEFAEQLPNMCLCSAMPHSAGPKLHSAEQID